MHSDSHKFFVTGGRHWGSQDSTGYPRTTLLRVSDIQVDGSGVRITGGPAGLTDILKDANIRFSTNVFSHKTALGAAYEATREQRSRAERSNRKQSDSQSTMNMLSNSNKQRQQLFGMDFIRKSWDEIKSLAKTTEDIINTAINVVAAAVKLTATGSFARKGKSTEYCWGWNYMCPKGSSATSLAEVRGARSSAQVETQTTVDRESEQAEKNAASSKFTTVLAGKAPTSSAPTLSPTPQVKHLIPLDQDGKLGCFDCHFHSELLLTFDLQISNYELSYLSIVGSGNAATVINIHGDWQSQWTSEGKTKLTDSVIPPLGAGFMAGPLPIYVDMIVPLFVGYSAVAQAEAHVMAAVEASGGFEYGLVYENGGIEWVNKRTHDHDGAFQISGSADVAVEAYVMPVIAITVDKIATLKVGLKPLLQATGNVTASASFNAARQRKPGPCTSNMGALMPVGAAAAMQVGASYGFETSIGGEIGIKGVFSAMTWPMKAVAKMLKPIASFCVPIQNIASAVSGPNQVLAANGAEKQAATNQDQGLKLEPVKDAPAKVILASENGRAHHKSISHQATRASTPAFIGTGTVFQGKFTKNPSASARCTNSQAEIADERDVTLQIVDMTDIRGLGDCNVIFSMKGSVSYSSGVESAGKKYACTNVVEFGISSRNFGGPQCTLTFTKVNDDFSQCTDDNGPSCSCSYFPGATGSADVNFNNIVFQDPLRCYTGTLKRVQASVKSTDYDSWTAQADQMING